MWYLCTYFLTSLRPVLGSERVFKADLVLLAMGFVGPETKIIEELSVDIDPRGNVATPNDKYNTSIPKLYAAGGKQLFFCFFFFKI